MNSTAEIYKRVNPDGSVEFTDVPGSAKEEPVKLAPMSTFKATPTAPTRSPSSRPTASLNKYTLLKIISPADNTSIRDNAGNLSINVSVSPSLRAGHKLVLLVDGSSKAEGQSGQFKLTNIDRGSHTLQAKVIDAANKPLISSKTVTIHLQRFSALRNRAIAPNPGKK
jgi:hypothetical protein